MTDRENNLLRNITTAEGNLRYLADEPDPERKARCQEIQRGCIAEAQAELAIFAKMREEGRIMTLREFKRTYFPAQHVVEIKNAKQARSDFFSHTSCCWGNRVVEDTGWAIVGQPSAQHVGDKRTVFVCKTEIIRDRE